MSQNRRILNGVFEYPLSHYLDRVRQKKSLVHCITNYVTVNDCANVLLAAGASPVMADSQEEVEEIVTLADALTVNIGTINSQTVPSMFAAGVTAKKLGRPAVLDPVGVGASSYRTKVAKDLLKSGYFWLVRGNASEIRALAGQSYFSRGVDVSNNDRIKSEDLLETSAFLNTFARSSNCIIAVSGPIDIICDGRRTAFIRNGVPFMSRVTGTGCMSSVLCAAFLASCLELDTRLSEDDAEGVSRSEKTFVRGGEVEITQNQNYQNGKSQSGAEHNFVDARRCCFESIVAAVSAFGVCGEIAESKLKVGEGNASFRIKLIDAVCQLDGETLDRSAKVEIIES